MVGAVDRHIANLPAVTTESQCGGVQRRAPNRRLKLAYRCVANVNQVRSLWEPRARPGRRFAADSVVAS